MADVEALHKQFNEAKDELQKRFEDKVDKLYRNYTAMAQKRRQEA